MHEYMRLVRSVRGIRKLVHELAEAYHSGQDGYATAVVSGLLANAARELRREWPDESSIHLIDNLINASNPSDCGDCWTLAERIVPPIEDALDDFYSLSVGESVGQSIIDYLHPEVVASSYSHYRNGHYRDAVLNSVTAVFDLIRSRTGLTTDGSSLVQTALALDNPKLVISELETESGMSEQKGYIELLKGAYHAIRNPKAHSLSWDTSPLTAAQLLVFSSLLCRRIEESEAR